MKFGVQRMLAVGFAAAVVAVGFVALSTNRHYREEQQNFAWSAQTEEVLAELDAIILGCSMSQSAARGFAITGRQTYLTSYLEAATRLPGRIGRVRELTNSHPLHRRRIGELDRSISALLDYHRQTVQITREQGTAAGRERINSGRGLQLMQEAREVIDAMVLEEQRLKPVRWRAAELGATQAHATAIGLVAVILALLTVCFVLVRHLLATRRLREEALRRFATTLDERVRERTAQLETADAELRRAAAEQKRIEAEVLRVSDYEQQRLGHDLHDGIGQQLTAIELMLYQLATDCGATARQQVERIGQNLRGAIRELRALARGLAPFIVDAGGLQTALSGLVDLASPSVRCRLTCPQSLPPIDPKAAMQLYRIAQEALNNALKHSGATAIEIRLVLVGGDLQLEIADNGRGCVEASTPGPGLGLQIMRYRAGLIGARFTFTSRAGEGVTIDCSLPLSS